ncbi:MAG: hypothetical protein E4H16_01550 [Candidatus Atribacteria bacterium]|nr:MAG: hypothetical protein E4H16_01550 [Candidatus Atribacteria bacterium]
MAEQTQFNSNPVHGPAMRRPLGSGQSGSTADALTPKDIASILRRHVVLIVVLTILGILAGGASWFLFRKYAPEYTAQTFIRVLPPGDKDPMSIGSLTLQKDILYEQRFGMATLIKSENYLMDLLKSDKVRETEWFKRFGSSTEEAMIKAIKKLKKKLGATAMRDADFVIVTMQCRQKSSAKTIVDEMVRLFISARRTSEEGDVGEKLVSLNTQKKLIEFEIATIDSMIAAARTGAKVDDLAIRNYRDTIELRLDNLQIQKSDLELQIRAFESIVVNMKQQTEGSIEDQFQVRQQIESDQSMIVLTQRLSFLKADLQGIESKFGENHRQVRQLREQIQKNDEERNIRRKEIAEQTRQSNLKDS